MCFMTTIFSLETWKKLSVRQKLRNNTCWHSILWPKTWSQDQFWNMSKGLQLKRKICSQTLRQVAKSIDSLVISHFLNFWRCEFSSPYDFPYFITSYISSLVNKIVLLFLLHEAFTNLTYLISNLTSHFI